MPTFEKAVEIYIPFVAGVRACSSWKANECVIGSAYKGRRTSVSHLSSRERSAPPLLVLKVGCALGVRLCALLLRAFLAGVWQRAPEWERERERGLLLGLHYWLTGPRLSSSSSSRRPPTSCRRGAANHNRSRALFIYIYTLNVAPRNSRNPFQSQIFEGC